MNSDTKNIAVLISGSGTNLQALIDNQDKFKGKIKLIISSKEDAYGLERGKKAGIKSVFERDNDKILDLLLENNISLIVLAGYLKILPKELVAAYRNEIINIHPSLIPSFCGMGFYGIKVHEAAIKRGVKITGATTHFVNEGADEGPIIMQKAVEVKEEDTPLTLQQKVLDVEHEILAKSVELFTEDKIYVRNNRVFIRRQN